MQLINNVKNAQKNNSLNWQHRFHLNLDVVGRSGNKSMNSDFRVNTNLLKGYLSSKTQLLEYFAFVYLSYRSHATVKLKPHDSCHGSFLSYLFITFFACFTCKSLQIKKYIYILQMLSFWHHVQMHIQLEGMCLSCGVIMDLLRITMPLSLLSDSLISLKTLYMCILAVKTFPNHHITFTNLTC